MLLLLAWLAWLGRQQIVFDDLALPVLHSLLIECACLHTVYWEPVAVNSSCNCTSILLHFHIPQMAVGRNLLHNLALCDSVEEVECAHWAGKLAHPSFTFLFHQHLLPVAWLAAFKSSWLRKGCLWGVLCCALPWWPPPTRLSEHRHPSPLECFQSGLHSHDKSRPTQQAFRQN